VNLAARLMSHAPLGQIYVSDPVRRGTGDAFAWARLPDIAVKGKAEPVVVHTLTGRAAQGVRRNVRNRLPMFGRDAELGHLKHRLEQALAGEGAVVGIAAEAGMGKSRLIAEFVRGLRQQGYLVAFGECQAFGRNTSYFAWREIWRTLFRLRDRDSPDVQIAALEKRLADVEAGLVSRLPLLGPLVDLAIPDNELTASLEAKLRKTSLESLLSACLRAEAGVHPIVLVIEDCHWLDELSRELLVALARVAVDLRVVIVLAYRPPSGVGDTLGVESLPYFSSIALSELGEDQARSLIAAKLQDTLGAGVEPPAALVDLIVRRAQGNPFYIEELLNYLRSRGIGVADVAALTAVDLPDSLNTLILSRIDGLREEFRRPLKVASVVGRTFRAPFLPLVYPELGDTAEVIDRLQELGRVDLVIPDVEADESWLFKHAITQEVTYESLPFAMRELLHDSTARVLETTHPDAAGQDLDLIAYHYWHSANREKKLEYLDLAAKAARARYANGAAIESFERLAKLQEGTARAATLLQLAGVLELTGAWSRASDVAAAALALAEASEDVVTQATAHTALAEIARKTGLFDEAEQRLRQAGELFAATAHEAGLGRVLHLRGTLAAQRGDYVDARSNYVESLRIREQLDDRASLSGLLSNLGVVAEYEGDYEASRSYHERALAVRTELGDRWAIGVSQTNLGMIASLERKYDEARDRFGEAIRLNMEIGDPWMVAICHNNLGNANRGLADYPAARNHYAASLQTYRDYGDRWALAFLIEDIALLASLVGAHERALMLMGAADAMREEIGAPRPPALESELNRAIATSVGVLGDGADATRDRGTRNDFDTVISSALDLLRT
jgi:tetratricopeptide (TPR) repeat protein